MTSINSFQQLPTKYRDFSAILPNQQFQPSLAKLSYEKNTLSNHDTFSPRFAGASPYKGAIGKQNESLGEKVIRRFMESKSKLEQNKETIRSQKENMEEKLQQVKQFKESLAQLKKESLAQSKSEQKVQLNNKSLRDWL
jgi:hypothetical protein